MYSNLIHSRFSWWDGKPCNNLPKQLQGTSISILLGCLTRLVWDFDLQVFNWRLEYSKNVWVQRLSIKKCNLTLAMSQATCHSKSPLPIYYHYQQVANWHMYNNVAESQRPIYNSFWDMIFFQTDSRMHVHADKNFWGKKITKFTFSY